jgi:hypothetical protein
MKKTSTRKPRPESECSMTDLNTYKKLKRVNVYLKELNTIRNDLIMSGQHLAVHCEKHNDLKKIYNEICETVQVYTRLIDTYTKHKKRLEDANGDEALER